MIAEYGFFLVFVGFGGLITGLAALFLSMIEAFQICKEHELEYHRERRRRWRIRFFKRYPELKNIQCTPPAPKYAQSFSTPQPKQRKYLFPKLVFINK